MTVCVPSRDCRRPIPPPVRFAALLLLWCVAGCVVPPPDGEGGPVRPREREGAVALRDRAGVDALNVLTPDDACRIAEANNPDFTALHHSVAAAEARYRQALGAYLPGLDLTFGAGQNLIDRGNVVNPQPATMPFASHFDLDLTARAGLLLFDGLRREFAALAARDEAEATVAQRSNALRLLRRSVVCAYCDAYLAEALLEVAVSDVEFRRSCLAQASVRFRNGYLAEGDYLGFRIDLNRALARVALSRSRRETARCALAALMGCRDGHLPPDLPLAPPEAETADRNALALDFYWQLALLSRPDLAAARLQVRIARWRELQGIGAFAPVVNLVAGGGAYFRARNHAEYVLGYGILADWKILPLWTRFQRLRELREAQAVALLREDAAAIAALAEVESSYALRESAAAALRLYRESLLWVRRQRELVAVEYWAGQVTITRLRGAQNDLVEAECGCAAALAEVVKAEAQLLAAVGGRW